MQRQATTWRDKPEIGGGGGGGGGAVGRGAGTIVP